MIACAFGMKGDQIQFHNISIYAKYPKSIFGCPGDIDMVIDCIKCVKDILGLRLMVVFIEFIAFHDKDNGYVLNVFFCRRNARYELKIRLTRLHIRKK